MKSPDQIKKALECCFNASQCGDCPYYPVSCDRELVRDAREYIRQLEAERDAAVADLKYVAVCETCKEFHRSALTEPCLHCTKYGLLDSENKYEWRGVQKEE